MGDTEAVAAIQHIIAPGVEEIARFLAGANAEELAYFLGYTRGIRDRFRVESSKEQEKRGA